MSRQIHITALAPYKIYPVKKGGQKGIALFYKYFSRELPVSLISTRDNEQHANGTMVFLPVLGNSRLRYINPFLFFKFARIIRENKSTHFIVEHPYFGWLCMFFKKKQGIKFIIHSHNIESIRFKTNGKWWWYLLWQYEKFSHRCADINFFITENDRQYAISQYKLHPDRCHTITYGTETENSPSVEKRAAASKKVRTTHHIDGQEKILFFNGALGYKPNLDALDLILNQINPLLNQAKDYPYKIIISGIGLPERYNNLRQWKDQNVIYTGFVEDIDTYFMAADIFINPVTDGGGIKTKLVEALANNVNAVSFSSGAIGIPETITGKKLSIIPDGDYTAFSNSVLHFDFEGDIPGTFFDHFQWKNIAKKAAAIIQA